MQEELRESEKTVSEVLRKRDLLWESYRELEGVRLQQGLTLQELQHQVCSTKIRFSNITILQCSTQESRDINRTITTMFLSLLC